MAERTYTEAEVGRIVAAALERLARDGAGEPRLYSLDEVADMTRINARWIKDECRARRLTHVHRDRTRGMTPDQVDELLAKYTVRGETVAQQAAGRGALTAVQMTRRNAARSGRRKTA